MMKWLNKIKCIIKVKCLNPTWVINLKWVNKMKWIIRLKWLNLTWIITLKWVNKSKWINTLKCVITYKYVKNRNVLTNQKGLTK